MAFFPRLTCTVLVLMMELTSLGPARPVTAGEVDDAWRSQFLRLCDVACKDLNQPKRKAPFFQDAYAVRALAVAYDITHDRPYLDVARAWSDRMLDFQDQMTPRGAYYMHYGRKPGAMRGEWYVADGASISLGVLATAVRCRDAGDEDRYRRYLASVKAYARLTIDNYVGPGGGITDGLWSKFDGEWYCSSGIFASTAMMLYAETGDESYRRVALGSIDWLNRLQIDKAQHISFQESAPAVIMYVFEGYSTAMSRLEPGSPRQTAALGQWKFALDWMARNQASREKAIAWDYETHWGSKLGGLPFHMYVYAHNVPGAEATAAAADRELRHVCSLCTKAEKPTLTQLACFALMSYAERVKPGAIYRTSKP